MQATELEKTFIFHYKLYQNDGKEIMGMKQANKNNTNFKASFIDLWERICGRRY